MDALHDAHPAGRTVEPGPAADRRPPGWTARATGRSSSPHPPHLRRYLELGALLGSIYIVQNFDAVFITSAAWARPTCPTPSTRATRPTRTASPRPRASWSSSARSSSPPSRCAWCRPVPRGGRRA
ncbi:hypothetical protein LV779_32620 [Streptomyces thinghirensis]|nr:hypothetical protein [Streptomyces thinghirensis]